MKKVPLYSWFGLFSAIASLIPSKAVEADFTVRSLDENGTISYELDKGIIHFSGGALLSYSNLVVRAESGWANTLSNQFRAEGSVRVERDGEVWQGEVISYDGETGKFEAESFRVGQAPFFAAGARVVSEPETGYYRAQDAYVTTDDVAEPFPKVRARELTLDPGHSITAEGAKLTLGDTPVMYFPRFRQSMDNADSRLALRPGVRSQYGAFLRTRYDYYQGEQSSASWNTDLFSERGLGLGPDFQYDLGERGHGLLSGYYINDMDPGAFARGRVVPEDRHRIHVGQSLKLDETFTAALVLNDQSDPLFNRDFFESDFRENPQAPSYLELLKWWDNYSLSFYAQPQIDGFFETVERLPQLKFNSYRQQIGELPLYYESESRVGWYRRRFADGDPALDFEATRADTFHQVVSPHMIGGWLNVMPKAGVRFTHYGEADGAGGGTDTQERWVYHSGVDFSTRISRTWPGAKSAFWDIAGLRHILYPSINYMFVPSPDVRPFELPQFDPQFPTLRLLPIDFPDFNSIDAIDSENVIRFGLRNKFQTHRESAIQDLLHWAVFADWRLDPRPGQSTFSDVYSDLDLRPRSWLVLNSEIQYDVDRTLWKQANHTFTIVPGNRWSWSLGHRYVRDDLIPGVLTGNNLFVSSLYFRVNENWGARATHQYESRDGVLEEQEYFIYRDFRSWTSALSFRVRDLRQDVTDYRISLRFSFKAFPRFAMGNDRDYARSLLGGQDPDLYDRP